jgi:hypothetical protein
MSDTDVYQDAAFTTAAVNTSVVGGWMDQSGNNNHLTQATAGNKPIYVTNAFNGYPLIRFDGTDDFLNLVTGSSFVGTAYCIFCVFAIPSNKIRNMCFLCGTDNSANNVSLHFGSRDLNIWTLDQFGNGLNTSIDATIDPASRNIVSGIRRTTGRGIWHNGWLKGYDNETTLLTSYTGAGMGKFRPDSDPQQIFLQGDVVEIIVYAQNLSEDDRRKIQKYFGVKYNIDITV